jgi:death-on-curing family protein
MDLLESAMAQPFASAFGQDAYLDVVSKAAALFRSLIANHPFGNGNKRTAVVVVDYFLSANGSLLNLSNDQMYELARQTARYRLRNLSHDESLAEITETRRRSAISLSLVRISAEHDPRIANLHSRAMEMRKRIRRDPMNQLMPAAK